MPSTNPLNRQNLSGMDLLLERYGKPTAEAQGDKVTRLLEAAAEKQETLRRANRYFSDAHTLGQTRSGVDVARDAAIDTASMATQTVLGAAQLGALPADWWLGTNMSTGVAKASDYAGQVAYNLSSDLKQARTDIHSREAQELQAARNEVYEQQKANGDDSWKPWLQRFGQGVKDTVQNYADDPIMLGSLVPEMVGSMIPSTLAIKALGKANALRKLASQGMTKTQAEKFLTTRAGQKVLNNTMLGAVGPVVAVTEGGSAANQAQIAILSMTPEEMAEAPEYRELIAQNMSHEDAQIQLAKQAAVPAAMTGGIIGLLTSRLGRQFEVSPLAGAPRAAAGRSITAPALSLGANTSKEAVEEFVQELGSTLGANLGEASVGLRTDIGEGLGAAGAEGMLGGALGSGAMGTPSAVINTAKGTARSVYDAAGKLFEDVKEKREEERDASDPAGSAAAQDAASTLLEYSESIAPTPVVTPDTAAEQATQEQVTPNQGVPTPPTPEEDVVQSIDKAFFVPDDEAQSFIEVSETLKQRAEEMGGKLDRASVVSELAKLMSNPANTKEINLGLAVSLLGHLTEMKNANSSEMDAKLDQLPEDHAARSGHEAVKNGVKFFEGNAAVKNAKELVASLTVDDVKTTFLLDKIIAGELEGQELADASSDLKTIGKYNPTLLTTSEYDQLLEQVTGTNPILEESLMLSKTLADSFINANNVETSILKAAKSVIKTLTGKAKKKALAAVHNTRKKVGEDVRIDGNSNNDLRSLKEYQASIRENFDSGRLDEVASDLYALRQFALSMSNKVEALNKSFNEGTHVQNEQGSINKNWPSFNYRQWSGSQWKQSKNEVFANPNYFESRLTAQAVKADANLVAGVYNHLLAAYNEKLTAAGLLADGPVNPAVLTDGMDVEIKSQHPTPEQSEPTHKELSQAEVDEINAEMDLQEAAEQAEADADLAGRMLLDVPDDLANRALSRNPNKGIPKIVKTPFTNMILRHFGRFDPNGEVGKELINADILPKTHRKYFQEGGAKNVDNLPADETGDYEFLVSHDDNGYLDPKSVIAAMIEEANGVPLSDFAQQEAEAEREVIAKVQELHARSGQEVGDRRRNPEVLEKPVTPKQKKPKQKKPKQTEPKQTETPEPDLVEEPVEEFEFTLENLFPNVIQSVEGTNKFLETFSVKNLTRLMLTLDPRKLMAQLFSAGIPISDTYRDLTDEQAKLAHRVTQGMFDHLTKKMNETLNATLKHKGKKGTTKSLEQRLLEDEAALGYNNAKGLNLIQKKEDGTYEYDPRVVMALAIASLEKIMKNLARPVLPLSDHVEIRKKLGMNKGAPVDKSHLAAYASGPLRQQFIDAIERDTLKLLGIKPNKDDPLEYAQGVFRGLAASAYVEIRNAGYITETSHNHLKGVPANNAYTTTTDGKQKTIAELKEKLAHISNPISRFITGERNEYFIGTAPEKEDLTRTQKHSSVPTTPNQNKAIGVLSSIPAYFNDLARFVEELGFLDYAKLVGYADVDKVKMNEEHRESVKGKNRSIQIAVEALNGYLNETDAHADENKVKREDVPIYNKWDIQSQGRAAQSGPGTAQRYKLLREAMNATVATLDMTDFENEDAQYFWLAVAQALDVDIDVGDHADAIEEVMDLVYSPEGAFYDAVKEFEARLDNKDYDPSVILKAIKSIPAVYLPGGNPDRVLSALMHVARLNKVDQEGLSNFETALSVESDGVTDGPMHAMMNFMTGAFDENQLTIYEMGGLFFGKDRQDMNLFRNGTKKDLYLLGQIKLQAKLEQRLKHANSVKRQEMEDVFYVLDALLPDFTYTSGGPIGIMRNLIKNPLTIFLYGSGKKGVAGNIADELKSNLYAEFTKMLQGDDSLIQKNPEIIEKLGNITGDSRGIQALFNNPASAKLNEKQYNVLSAVILENFAETMFEAIDETTLGLRDKMQLVLKTSQVQAEMFKQNFDHLMAKTGKPAHKLSQKEIEAVYVEASKAAPIYYTDDHTFFVSGKDSITGDTVIATSLNDGVESKYSSFTPEGEIGVRAQPMLTIGTGEGSMILHIYQDGTTSVMRSLPVFDGVEFSIDTFKEGSLKLNEAVHKIWTTETAYQATNESLRASLLKGNLQDTAATRKILGRENISKLGFKGAVNKLVEDMQIAADSAAARKAAVGRMHTWNDHMAGAKAPFESKGATGRLEKLNEFYLEELEALRAEAHRTKTKRTEPAQKNKAVFDLVQKQGEEVEVSKGKAVWKLTGEAVSNFYKKAAGFSKDQEQLLWQVLQNHEALQDFTFYFGKPEDLDTLKANKFGGLNQKNLEKGQTFAGTKVAFIASTSPETLLHEMLHALTHKLLVDHYAGKGSKNIGTRAAIKQIELLIEEFVNLNFEFADGDIKAAGQTLQQQLKRYEKDPAVRAGEFISWMLSNQSLIEISKKTEITNPLKRIAHRLMKAMKKLFKITSYVGNDLFSNVRFSTELLLKANESYSAITTDQLLEQVYGSDEKLDRLQSRFVDRFMTFAQTVDKVDAPKEAAEVVNHTSKKQSARNASLLVDAAQQAASAAHAAGFTLNERSAQIFQDIHAMIQSGLGLDPTAMSHIYKVYAGVVKELKWSDFLLDQENATDVDRNDAERMYNFLLGHEGLRKTSKGKTDLIATFVSLAQVHDGLRKVLENINPPKTVEKGGKNVDEFIETWASNITNVLTSAVIGKVKLGRTARQQMDTLTEVLATNKENKVLEAEEAITGVLVKADNYLAGKINEKSEEAYKKLRNTADKTSGLKSSASFVLAVVASFGSKKASADIGKFATTHLDKVSGWAETKALLRDFRGNTEQNVDFNMLVNKVKAGIDGVRQKYRERVPKDLAKGFSRELEKHEWEAMHVGIGQTDLTLKGRRKALELLKDFSGVSGRIDALEAALASENRQNGALYIKKSKELAKYMMTRQTSPNLLRNARAIGLLLEEGTAEKVKPSKATIEIIDELTTLYAVDMLDPKVKKTLESLSQQEGEGMQDVVGFLYHVRSVEYQKASNVGNKGFNSLNGLKGYTPEFTKRGQEIIIADDADHKEKVKQGYVRVGSYKENPGENYEGRRSYYRTNVGGRNPYRQGVAQNVHSTFNGVDTRTGSINTGDTYGAIRGRKAMKIQSAVRRARGSHDGTHLMPIFDEDNMLVGYDIPISAEELSKVDKDRHMGRMLGTWAGRQAEEEMAHQFNRELLEQLHVDYKKALANNEGDQFENVAARDQKDVLVKYAWDTMGEQIKEDAAEIFGKKNFLPVRRSEIPAAIGYPAATLTDPLTGVTRMHPNVQKALMNVMQGIFGDNAYKYMKLADLAVTDAVSWAKTTIVVRSYVVARDNVFSNILHLMSYGIGPIEAGKILLKKYVELSQYVKNEEELQSLEIKLEANLSGGPKLKKIKAQIRALKEANSSVSFRSLIDAGEFNTVAEDLSEADQSLREGMFGEYINKVVDKSGIKLNKTVESVGKNLMMTKDTALYRGLNRMVQYGDFTAKAVLYDHLKEKRGMSDKAILKLLNEEFVNYNQLSGRGRDFLESHGMLWFTNYKLRIAKIALSMFRDRPLSALMVAGVAGPALNVDTVATGSLMGTVWDGSIGYAVGPEMGFGAPSLLPINVLAN